VAFQLDPKTGSHFSGRNSVSARTGQFQFRPGVVPGYKGRCPLEVSPMTGIPLRGPPTPMKPRLYLQNYQSQHVPTALLKFLEGFLGQRVQRQPGNQTYEK
jgi:hypothetical protein